MTCFRDRAFCTASDGSCCNTECPRFFSADDDTAAREWWADVSGEDGSGAPISWGDFASSCPDIQPPMNNTAIDLKKIIVAAARRLEIDLRVDADELKVLGAQLIIDLSAAYGENGFLEAAEATRDIIALNVGVRSVEVGDAADAELRGIILGFITAAAGAAS